MALIFRLQKQYGVAMARKAMVQNLDTMQQLAEEMQIDINAAIVKQEQLFEAQVKLFEDDLDAKRARYEADKRNCDRKAFVKVDADNDGRLQEDEVVDALTPETAAWADMHSALGLVDKPHQMIENFLEGWVKQVQLHDGYILAK